MSGPKPSIKVGDVFETNSCGDCEVVKYENNEKITVKFLETGTEVVVRGGDLKKGKAKDRYHPSIYGVGYTGGVTTVMSVTSLKSYKAWMSMLRRCYSQEYEHYVRYGAAGVTVHKDWYNYSNFKKWYDKNVPEGYHVDKDLLSGPSKIYSEETCCALPSYLNQVLICSNSNKASGLPVGVTEKHNKFQSQISIRSTNRHLGYFNTPDEAHQVWRIVKIKYIQELAEESYSKGEITEQVYNALMRWEPPEN